ncbi:MAG: UDP-N-acetylmuramoyl-L-alanyl-D-glutamate--2,6-diaminopimelate ligase, partial [Synechococcaceae bacterium WB9_2_112]|nr:UDP-N-acetylmuramoyl-L-alanyl-D-glutamate--2,6-diaminopimelate ligase [Synechococcaceae bacterium WB9_2_112]
MSELLHSLLHQVGLEPNDQLANAAVTSISCDSRRQGRGSLFIGIEGTRVDGGIHWREALSGGACAALISAAAAAA